MIFIDAAPGQAGQPYFANDGGAQVRTFGRFTVPVVDANATVTAAQLQNGDILEVTTGPFTAQRNIILPLTSGLQLTVANLQGGAFGAQFIGASGTGVVVAQNKRAVIYCDGTNWQRVTPDT